MALSSQEFGFRIPIVAKPDGVFLRTGPLREKIGALPSDINRVRDFWAGA